MVSTGAVWWALAAWQQLAQPRSVWGRGGTWGWAKPHFQVISQARPAVSWVLHFRGGVGSRGLWGSDLGDQANSVCGDPPAQFDGGAHCPRLGLRTLHLGLWAFSFPRSLVQYQDYFSVTEVQKDLGWVGPLRAKILNIYVWHLLSASICTKPFCSWKGAEASSKTFWYKVRGPPGSAWPGSAELWAGSTAPEFSVRLCPHPWPAEGPGSPSGWPSSRL